jgi:hypothetical protein
MPRCWFAGTLIADCAVDLFWTTDAKLAIGHGDLQRWYGAVLVAYWN